MSTARIPTRTVLAGVAAWVWVLVAAVGSARAAHDWRTIPTRVPLSAYTFKYANYVCFWVEPGKPASVKLINDYRPGRDWKTDVVFQVFTADRPVGEFWVAPGQTRAVRVAPPQGELVVVFMTSRRTHHRVDVGDRPWAFVGYPTKGSIDVVTTRPQERLYFHVPAHAERIALRAYPLSTGSHSYIVMPDGTVGLDFVKQPTGLSTPHQVWQPVLPAARGQVCSWVLPAGMRRLALMPDPQSPPLMSPNPNHVAFLVGKLQGRRGARVPGASGAARPPAEVLAPYTPVPRHETPDHVGTLMPLIYCSEYINAERVLDPTRFVRLLTTRGTTGPHFLELGLHGPFSTLFGDTSDLDFHNGMRITPDLKPVRGGARGQPVDTPEQILAKARLFAAMNQALARAGVAHRAIYTNASYYYGNPKKRLGVFHLYDHWDTYAKLFPDLGPKPDEPPDRWTRWRDGQPTGPSASRLNTPGLLCYTASLNSPSWQRFFGGVVAVAARYGASAVHLDCAGQHYCASPRAEAGFRAYLCAKYTSDQLEDLFGFDKPERIKQAPIKRGWVNPTLLDVERERYQLGVVTPAFWDAARRAGERVRGTGRFWVHAASEEGRDYYAGHHDSVMFEEYERFVGLMEREILPGVIHRRYGSLIYEYKSDQAYAALPLGRRPRFAGAILSRNRSFGEYAVRLGIAEAAAFSSGGGGFATLSPGYVFDVMRAFFERHPDLYDGYLGAGVVGVYQNFENRIILYNHEEHIAANTRVCAAMMERHVPFDFVSSAAASLSLLDTYKLIAALSMANLSGAKLAELAQYVRRGGLLVVDDRFAVQDETLRTRQSLPWGREAGQGGYDVRFGQGRVKALTAPIRASDVLDAIGQMLGELPVLARGGPGLRTNILRRDTGPHTHLVIHMLNHNVPLVTGTWDLGNGTYREPPRKPRAIESIELSVPLPPGRRVARVAVTTPDFEITPHARFRIDGARLLIHVDRLFIYNVVSVRLTR